MDAELLVKRLNELAERLPRITATLAMQHIPIDLAELANVGGHDQFGHSTGQRPIPVKFNIGHSGASTMSFVGLLCGLCDDANGVGWKFQTDGTIIFFVD